VQYGAASSLCLEFASRINGFEQLFATGSSIDARCLGGSIRGHDHFPFEDDLRRYWAGRRGTRLAHSVENFLADYSEVCTGMADWLKPGGIAVLIVGQRSTGGYRLKLDGFTFDRFSALGLQMVSIEQRRLKDKRLPRKINRYGRSSSSIVRAKGITRTMSSETVLAFQKASWSDQR
jgi:site-specific DNA-methyltransferase (cytosine-N4-specific)